jgi:hypothetical protein
MNCVDCGTDKNVRKCGLCNQTFCFECRGWIIVKDPPPKKTLSDGTVITIKVLKMHYECGNCHSFPG